VRGREKRKFRELEELDGPGWGKNLWNILSREKGKIGSKSREKGDLSPCTPSVQ